MFLDIHGQDLDNANNILNGHRDQPLSALGQEQAQVLAEKIKKSGVHFDAIYTSPLRRAKQTANIIGETIQVEVKVNKDLIERDFGILTGKPYSDISKLSSDKILQGDKVLYFLEADECESFPCCYERAQRVLNCLDVNHPGKQVLLVCHGDIGKMLVAARKGISWREGILLPYFENTKIISFAVVMPPSCWKKTSRLSFSNNAENALKEYIRQRIQANNCLNIGEDEMDGMVDLLLQAKTRAEVLEWTKTLMFDDSFAAEVIKRRVDHGPPFEGETVESPLAVSTSLMNAKSKGKELTISKHTKRSAGKRPAASKKGATGSALKPGHFECGCFATVHNLRRSCANCGRIVCEQEADDMCYFCGLDPTRCIAYEIAIQEGKLTDEAQKAYVEDYEEAIARRDTLLGYARNRAKRTIVIDDQSASLFGPQSAWVSPEERRKQEKSLADLERAKAVERMHKHKGSYEVHLDFVNRNITLGARQAPETTRTGVLDASGGGGSVAADKHSNKSDTDASEAACGDLDMPLAIEGRAKPSPSVLQKIWYNFDGSPSEPKVDNNASVSNMNDPTNLTMLNEHCLRSQVEVSKRVQQSYFEEDFELFMEEMQDRESVELFFNPDTVEDNLSTLEEENGLPTAPIVASSAESLASLPQRFAPTRSMKLRDDGVCLSMHQPWASLLVAGIKTHEGRVWSTNYRGRLWIHAGSMQPSNMKEVELHYAQFVPPAQVFPKHYPTRVLLGYVYLTECLDQDSYQSLFPPEERQVDSPFVFICTQPTPLLFPLPMSGNHKLFTLERKVRTAAKKQLKEIS